MVRAVATGRVVRAVAALARTARAGGGCRMAAASRWRGLDPVSASVALAVAAASRRHGLDLVAASVAVAVAGVSRRRGLDLASASVALPVVADPCHRNGGYGQRQRAGREYGENRRNCQ